MLETFKTLKLTIKLYNYKTMLKLGLNQYYKNW